MTRRVLRVTLPALLLACAIPSLASAAVGDLTYRDCVTGNADLGPAGANTCTPVPGATVTGANSGLEDLESIAVSPDASSVYVVTQFDHSVAAFRRDPANGNLSFVNCVMGELTAVGNCDDAPGATLTGDNSGMREIESVAVSPDGRSVYATSRFDDSIIHLARNQTTGAVSYAGCISGEQASTPPCTALPSETVDGQQSGFDDPKLKAPVFTQDGRFVFVSAASDDSILRFARNPTTGALTYLGCLTAEAATVGACTALPNTSADGSATGMNEPRWLTVGPEGRSLYVVANGDSAISRFAIDTASGALAFQDCITGDSGAGPGGTGVCSAIPSAAPTGLGSGLDDLRALAISPDGSNLYAAAGNDTAISTFSRDAATGALGYGGCITADSAVGPAPGSGACAALASTTPTGADSGFDGMRSIAISDDGRSLYLAAQFDDTLAEFDRDLLTGALGFSGCITAQTTVTGCTQIPAASASGMGSGLHELETIALARDRHLYGAAEVDDAIARFDREPDLDPPETTLTKKPKKRTKKRRARFAFIADEPLATFECRLDKKAFAPCESPLRTKKLKRKKHKFRVRAIDTAGNVDPTPAKRKWKVKKKRKR